jgi:peptide/nickel transport system permease protein
LSRIAIVFRHALPNAMAPVVALAAVQLGFLLGGSVAIESVFALDGLGYLAWQSISRNDFPVTLAAVLLLSILYIVLMIVADLLNAWLDPRLRLS